MPTVLPDVSGRTWIEERQDTVNFQEKHSARLLHSCKLHGYGRLKLLQNDKTQLKMRPSTIFPPPSVFKQAAASRMTLDVFAEETCGGENHYAFDFLAAQICRTKTVCYGI